MYDAVRILSCRNDRKPPPALNFDRVRSRLVLCAVWNLDRVLDY